eukprot:scaffold11309_cov145-Amphora_coffeaeformis.AAC.5
MDIKKATPVEEASKNLGLGPDPDPVVKRSDSTTNSDDVEFVVREGGRGQTDSLQTALLKNERRGRIRQNHPSLSIWLFEGELTMRGNLQYEAFVEREGQPDATCAVENVEVLVVERPCWVSFLVRAATADGAKRGADRRSDRSATDNNPKFGAN